MNFLPEDSEFRGPTIGAKVSKDVALLAIDLYALIQGVMEGSDENGITSMKLDWNGLNPRPYDMSFVPMYMYNGHGYIFGTLPE